MGVDPRHVLGTDADTWERVGATFASLHTAGRRPQGKAGDDLRPARVVDVEDINGCLTTWLRH